MHFKYERVGGCQAEKSLMCFAVLTSNVDVTDRMHYDITVCHRVNSCFVCQFQELTWDCYLL